MEGRFYWSDISGRAIRSALFNGSMKSDFIKDDIMKAVVVNVTQNEEGGDGTNAIKSSDGSKGDKQNLESALN
ncbi:hypothetical protein NQ318_000504 [Aromia moschata]|uniref:Uncharacterized protein n=1 Tax=Aromia moschata TaxID=1265417 RepID=A0AAV8YF39_9CUCU|nr:hypothetical protein NQ318_000504 [Aromia moschata]